MARCINCTKNFIDNCVHGPSNINTAEAHSSSCDIQDDLDKALKLIPCDWCTSKGQSHCNHAKPAPVVQYLAEALCASLASGSSRMSFCSLCLDFKTKSFLVLQNCICNLSVSWNQYQASYLQSRLALASYQSQLSKFAVDLLLARDYHQFDLQYWISCRLVTLQAEVDEVFAAAEGCLHNDATGLDPANAVVALFNAQAQMTEFVHRLLGNSEYIWPVLPSARTWLDRRNEARSQANLPPLSSEKSRDTSPIETAPPPSASSSSQPIAVSSQFMHRSAAAAEAVASVSAGPRSRSSSSSFELQTFHPHPKRGGKPVNLSATKRG